MTLKPLWLLAAVSGICVGTSAQATTQIDFETTAGGAPTVLGSSVGVDYAPLGLTFNNAFYAECGGGCPDPSLGAFISSSNFSSPFSVTFSSLISNFSAVNVSYSSALATAYDGNGAILGTSAASSGQYNGAMLSFGFGGIKSITFQGNNSGFGVDNFRFDAGVSAVPEPATWAMMLFGFGAIGMTMRRRRRGGSTLAHIG